MNATMLLEKLEHFPVMLEKILSIITPQHGGTFIDCTFGTGGYSKAILSFPKTEVIALDRDKSVVKFVKILIKGNQNRFKFYNKKFSQIDTIFQKENTVKAIIFDLGYSTVQIKDLSRGFSFHSKGSLDMRMGFNSFSALETINHLNQKEIELILKYFGEEKKYKKIAFQIVSLRKRKRLNTKDLVEIIKKVKKKKYFKRINEATKCFQALRIFVNNEVTELITGLINAAKYLKPGSILLVVTFHSLEDRIVKYFFKTYSEKNKNPSRYLPKLNQQDKRLFDCPQKKPLIPSDKELLANVSSRSAKLRYVIRNNNKFIFPEEFLKKFQNYIDIENIGLKL